MNRSRLLAVALIAVLAQNACAAVVKVACVGDSITQGSGLSNPSTESYPAKLQRLLGTNYQVRNFGVSGRTLLRQGDYPYWVESAFTQSHSFEPDIVTIMLGTNDAKPYNWRYGTNFLTDYADLVASYTNLPSHPRVLICTPPPVFGNGAFDIKPNTVATNIAPLVRELGASLGLEVIDLHVLLAGHSEWFPDTVHPNTKGTTVLTAVFRTALLGAGSPGVAPTLGIGRLTGLRAELNWPADAGGWVLQSAPALRDASTTWTVVEQPAVNDGAVIRVTNSIPTAVRVYRLWNPLF